VMHIATILATRRTKLRHRHHRLQWENTMEKEQHNLLCGNNTRSNVSYSNVASMYLLFGLITLSLRSFSAASSWRLFSRNFFLSASHYFIRRKYFLFSSLILVSIHCSKSHSGGGVCKKCNCHNPNIDFSVCFIHMISYEKKYNCYHRTNADLTRCGIERIVVTHPIPLVIRFLFIGLGYLASITA
jgi:hypothetical protein